MPFRPLVRLAALLLACGATTPARPVEATPSPSSAAAPVADAPVILALGDSLTAGLGLAQSQAWPTLLQARIDAAGLKYRVVNAGISGDTTAAGLARIDWQLSQKPVVIILELGANDGLRGLSGRRSQGQPRQDHRPVSGPPAPACCSLACRSRRTWAPSTAPLFATCSPRSPTSTKPR
jgi:lysophospholipase L1-like esterase